MEYPEKENTELCNKQVQISKKFVSNMLKNKMYLNIFVNLRN